MFSVDLSQLDDDKLKTHHEMMRDCIINMKKFSTLSLALWSAVLNELDKRGLMRLISGSYDDVGNAHMQQMW